MKITVLAGGLSHEREVSLSSGSLIAGALIRKGYEVCLVDLYTGKAIDGSVPAFTRDPIEPDRVSRTVPDLEALKVSTGNGDRRIGEGVPALCHAAEAVFIALHGDVGENGQLQAFLDMEGIPYTGSGYAGSLLAMDKDLTKQMLTRAGVTNAPWVYCDLSCGVEATADRIERELGYPVVIKPCSGGSSVGVSMPENRTELTAAIEKAARYESTLMAERRIMGRELTVSYLGGEVLPAVEIIPLEGFYDYENKYQPGAAIDVCPAQIPAEWEKKLGEAALTVFHELGLSVYSRADFILTEDGTAYFLEINTLPGFTPTSLLPQEAAAAGIGYGELCEMVALKSLEARKEGM